MMLKFNILIIVFVTGIGLSPAQEPIQAYTRNSVSLNGWWNIIIDPFDNGYYTYRYEPFDELNYKNNNAYFADARPSAPHELIEYNYDKSPVLKVPGDWNTQDSTLFFYEGTVWYRNKFKIPVVNPEDRIFLYIGAANYRSDIYVNSSKIGTHTGGFTPFCFEITPVLNPEENSLVIRVNNQRKKEGIPTLNTDWWNYGGITRDVKLIVVPKIFIRDYTIHLISAEEKIVSGNILVDGAEKGEKITLTIEELNITKKLKTNEKGIAEFNLQIPKLELWSPDHPKLYNIILKTDQDELADKVGFRHISTENKTILLNGQSIFLRGISVHEEYAVNHGGRVKNIEEARQLLTWAKELNCNFVRLAHYPHNEHIVRLADEMGIMVWSEVPVYWTIDWENPETYNNARNQVSEMVQRDKNRASVIIWSLANETPVNDSRNIFLEKLAKHVKNLDSTRLLSAAMEKQYSPENPNTAIVRDPLADIVDIVSFNEYIGWYDGLPDKCEKINWVIPYNKPVFISEFGGGAKQGYHGNSNIRWTEEFQEDLYIKSLNMLDKIDGLCGMSPWILVDFRSPRRPLPDIQDYFNRKGLISEKGIKKKAFYILSDYYKAKKEN